MIEDGVKHVIVLGSPGSGKSYFSKKLGPILHLSVISLDDLFFTNNWVQIGQSYFLELQKEKMKTPCILEGNYYSSVDLRIESADLIIMLNKSLISCLYGITIRQLKNIFLKDKDLPKDVLSQKKSKISENGFFNFFRYVIKNYLQTNNLLLKKLNQNLSAKVVILNSRRECEVYLNELKKAR